MSSTAQLTELPQRLRALSAPDALPQLAIECSQLASNTPQGGMLILAHALLLSFMAQADGGLEEAEWASIQRSCAILASLIEFGAADATLAALAKEWIGHERPRSVQ